MQTKEEIKLNAIEYFQRDGALEAAKYLAYTLFAGKTDKGGAPYTDHLKRVAAGVKDEYKPAAWLHDLVEDIEDWAFPDLSDIGFIPTHMDIIRAVTKLPDEPYFCAMVRAGLTPGAPDVKCSDLEDNLNLFRLNRLPTEKDFMRTRKYLIAHNYQREIRDGIILPGTDFRDWMNKKPPEMQDFHLLKTEYTATRSAGTAFSQFAKQHRAP